MQIFNILIDQPVPKGLLQKILFRIDAEARLASARKRFVFFTVIFVVSVIAFVPVLQMAIADFASSGFIQFFSLIFTDVEMVIKYWGDFSFALLESLPIASTIFVLVILFALLESIKYLARYSYSLFNPHIYGTK